MEPVDYVKPTLLDRPPPAKGTPLLFVETLRQTITDSATTDAQNVHLTIGDILSTKVDATSLGLPNQETTVLQAIIIAMAQKAMQGSPNAAKQLMEWHLHGVAAPSTQAAPTTANTQVNIYNDLDHATKQMLASIGITPP